MSSSIIPTFRYRDAPAAIEFLCSAFGFERHLVVPGEDGSIIHAQLRFGNGMIMLSSATESDFGRMVGSPAPGNTGGQSPYLITAAIDAHYARAKAAGVEILLDNEDKDYGGRGYTARDPEGYVWSFGSYDPWAAD